MQADSRHTPPEEVVGLLAFLVKNYYQVLHATPDQAYKFYKDSSTIGRTGSDGVVEYVTTLPEIKKKLKSMDFRKYLTILIRTADAVSSANGGVPIVVTGSLTMPDGVCQKFTQSFLLAPIEGGYFVKSDTLRIMPGTLPDPVSQADNQENEIKQDVGSIAEPREAEHARTDHVSAKNKVGDLEVLNPTSHENYDDIQQLVKVTKEDLKGTIVPDSTPPQPQKDATSSSYPLIVTSLFWRLLNVLGYV